jgi:CMP-2-keto-3-deoxyoctulosonic acid synthetase
MSFLKNIFGRNSATMPRYDWQSVAHIPSLNSEKAEKLEQLRESLAENMLKIQAVEDIAKTGVQVPTRLREVLGESFTLDSARAYDAAEQVLSMLNSQLKVIENNYKITIESAGLTPESAKVFLDQDKQLIAETNSRVNWQSVANITKSAESLQR